MNRGAPGRTTRPAVTGPDRSDPAARDAAFMAGSALPATAVVSAYLSKSGDPAALLSELQAKAMALQGGDLRQIEEMLMHQAIALQAMFTDMACRAKNQSALASTQVLTQLALRAQSCSRATLQTLVELKNPRQVAFVQQANLANNQQVSNVVVPPSRAQATTTAPSKLIVEDLALNGSSSMDTGAAKAASRIDQDVAPLAELNRSSKRGGQAQGLP